MRCQIKEDIMNIRDYYEHSCGGRDWTQAFARAIADTRCATAPGMNGQAAWRCSTPTTSTLAPRAKKPAITAGSSSLVRHALRRASFRPTAQVHTRRCYKRGVQHQRGGPRQTRGASNPRAHRETRDSSRRSSRSAQALSSPSRRAQ